MRFFLQLTVAHSQVPYLHHIEILVTEQNPGIVLIFQTVAARDVQRDLKFLQRPIKSIPLGTQGHVQLLPQRAGCLGIESQPLVDSPR